MIVARCGGTATGAYLAAQRRAPSQSAGGRSATRVSFSPCSHPHRVGASWPVLCSYVTSPGGEERRTTEWEEVAHLFQPMVKNLKEMSTVRQVFDLEDYHVGMICGAFLACVGFYELWKKAPTVLVDATLAFMLYKLSVVSSELHRSRKSNSLVTRLKFGTILVMVVKDVRKAYVPLDFVRMPLFLVYITAFLFDVAGVKKYGRKGLISFVNLLKMRGGIQEIWRIMWYRGYVTPYDDGVDWSDGRVLGESRRS